MWRKKNGDCRIFSASRGFAGGTILKRSAVLNGHCACFGCSSKIVTFFLFHYFCEILFYLFFFQYATYINCSFHHINISSSSSVTTNYFTLLRATITEFYDCLFDDFNLFAYHSITQSAAQTPRFQF